MKRFSIIAVILLAILAVATFAFAQRGEQPKAEKNPYETKIKEGDIMPNLVAAAENSVNTLQADSLKGKIVLYNVFAYWCGPCNGEAPDLQELYSELKAKGVEIVGVAAGRMPDMKTDEFIEKNNKFVEKHKWTIPMIHDPENKATKMLGVKAFPTSFLVDRTGKIVTVVVGGGPGVKAEWLERINPLLETAVAQEANHECCGNPDTCPDKDCEKREK